jgi:hypothetical protein
MQAHTSRTDAFWQSVHEKQNQNPLSQAEYEEWRANPVTMRMFDDFEYSLLEVQTEMSGKTSDSDLSPLIHAELNALAQSVAKLFEWVPEELEGEE